MIQQDIYGFVLIVDDTPANIKILTAALKQAYRIGVATNGKKALEFARQNSPDLILLDIMMPEMDGYEVCRQLKSDKTTHNIPVIFITVLDELDNKTKGFTLGAVDYIIKPFNDEEVRSRVRTHVMLKKYQDNLEEQVALRTNALSQAKIELAEQVTALKVLLKTREDEKAEFGKQLIDNAKNSIFPYLEKLKKKETSSKKLMYLDILETNIVNLISTDNERLSINYINLTPAEIEVADLIKQNKSTKEIAEILLLSEHTIHSHRKHLREKLGIVNQKNNLRTFLQTLSD